MPLTEPTRMVLKQPTGASWRITPKNLLPDDADAVAYIAAVEAADGEALEPAVRLAINSFIKGCKADGIWPAIKASCILAGARTLNGALVPLVGAAPTNYNFVAGDYNRKTGLGGRFGKYLDTNRACSSEGLNNVHAAVYANSRDTSTGRYIGGEVGVFDLVGNTLGFRARVNTGVLNTHGTTTTVPATIGVSRSASGSYNWRDHSESGSQSTVSTQVSTGNYAVFASNTGANSSVSARLAFYSIGEALDLALLDTRVTTLINAFAAVIP